MNQSVLWKRWKKMTEENPGKGEDTLLILQIPSIGSIFLISVKQVSVWKYMIKLILNFDPRKKMLATFVY